MKKNNLAIIAIIASIFLVGCGNSNTTDNGKNNNNNSNNSINDSSMNDNNSNNSVEDNNINNNTVDNGTNNKLTIEQAKDIALQHAGLTNDQVSFLRTEYDIDDGIEKYDIEFNYNGREYDYEISVSNGDILSYE